MTVTFETMTSIAAPPSIVFDLSLSIDTHVESQASANERAVGGVTTGQIGLGEEVTWRATHFHVPFTMTSRITELERPHRFVDEQTRGPFRRFHHEHEHNRAREQQARTRQAGGPWPVPKPLPGPDADDLTGRQISAMLHG